MIRFILVCIVVIGYEGAEYDRYDDDGVSAL